MNRLFLSVALAFCVFLAVHGTTLDKKYDAVNRMSIPEGFQLPAVLMNVLKNVQATAAKTVKASPSDADPCDPNPCLNYGVCVVTGESFRCDCVPFVGGERCGYAKCIPIPFWPTYVPQPLYTKCNEPETCVLVLKTNNDITFLAPSCVCDDSDLCSDS